MRTFIALDFTSNDKTALSQLIETLRKEAPRLKWTAISNLHITLKFLGETSVQQVESIKQYLTGLSEFKKVFPVKFNEILFFPSASRPRVIALQGVNPDLSPLALQIENTLCGMGFQPEKHVFQPHLTIARLKEPSAVTIPANLEIQLTCSGRIDFFESILRLQGPEYRTLMK
ncbi:MAG: RNA 2',3'-cyclic phosphodiesterase [Candidatus Wallbacteria bacterium]|nr:RNA 2',3'-cyclic phosphodiesterase [Candidatus Wallbacteria bacterium]